VATKLEIEETEHTVRSHRAGYQYHKVGTCQRCGATAVAGPSYSSSQGPIDARNKPCQRRGQKQP
jgi:hypothetical protein